MGTLLPAFFLGGGGSARRGSPPPHVPMGLPSEPGPGRGHPQHGAPQHQWGVQAGCQHPHRALSGPSRPQEGSLMGAARLRGQQRGGGRACPLRPADSGAQSGLAPGMLGSEPCPAPPVGSGGPPRPIFTFQEGSTMAEKTSPGPGGGITPLQQMLASGTGAILTSLFVTPLDVVKIRLQAQRTPFSKGKCFLYCNGLMDHLYVCQNGPGCTAWYKAPPPARFTGTLDAFVKITRYEGIRSLWSGLPPTLVMAVPATVIYFTAYDQLRDYLHARTGSRGHHIPLLAGALARREYPRVISPLELIRTKMQSRQLSYRELRVCIQSAVAQDGWLSLWRGWGPTVLRDVPFSALYWFNYELVREWLCAQARLDEATFMISFASGAISGTVAAVLTLPFDVVKTQRQIELGGSEMHPVAASKPSSTWLLMRRIRAESGTRGLFAGEAVTPPHPFLGEFWGAPGVIVGLTALSLQGSCPVSLRWPPPVPS
uniref:Mitochondrial glutathione transporter SLC25A39 n=1 Tax=Anas platyrhynchos TaxID=8839 RepID=A0A8B9ZEA8_ANAPL